MKNTALKMIKSAKPLYVLHLSSGKAQIYFAKPKGAVQIELPSGLEQPSDLSLFAAQWPSVPWVILVDQSEETFWGGVMPDLKGEAKTAWIDRLSAQSGSDSIYRWSELQGKSRSQPDKVRVLGYTLSRSEVLTPWLDALFQSEVRIRGVYSPVMLTATALALLKIKPLKTGDEIGVLVTPHADGLRQSVLVGGKVRFSRLALHPSVSGAHWFETVYNETAKLREYLVSSSLLKSDRAGMRLYAVLPPGIETSENPVQSQSHPRDQYRWVQSPLADLVYVASLAQKQPLTQLAPRYYTKRDWAARAAQGFYALTAACAIAIAIYLSFGIAQLWQKQQEVDAANIASNEAAKKYQTIAKDFPPSPLLASQLVDMSKRWDDIKSVQSPDMRDILVIAGQILVKHPNMVIEKMNWDGDLPAPSSTTVPRPGQSPAQTKEKPEVASLVLGGNIRGIASDDLRGTRDALARVLSEFNRHPNIRAEVTKQPLDLSTKAALTGSGKQESSEISFEIKLWQR